MPRAEYPRLRQQQLAALVAAIVGGQRAVTRSHQGHQHLGTGPTVEAATEALEASIASGPPSREQLTAERRRQRVAEHRAALGDRAVTGPRSPAILRALALACPHCSAAPGDPCRTPAGNQQGAPHLARRGAVARAPR